MSELANQSAQPTVPYKIEDPLFPEKDSGMLLYSGVFVKLKVPSHPPMALDSGLSIIRRAVAAEGVLKVIAEGAITPDAWANLHIDASDFTVWAFGRVPETHGSWREPIVRLSRESLKDLSLHPNFDANTLRTLFGKYLPG